MNDSMGCTFTTLGRSAVAAAFGGWILIAALPGHAEEGFWSRWLSMVSRTQAEQPHWVTPLVTNTAMLTQAFHYDILSERLPDGSHLNSYGGGKGLEFIPAPEYRGHSRGASLGAAHGLDLGQRRWRLAINLDEVPIFECQ